MKKPTLTQKEDLNKVFDKQIDLGHDKYLIKGAKAEGLNEKEDNNVGDNPLSNLNSNDNNNQVDAPKIEKSAKESRNVLAMPNMDVNKNNLVSSSTRSSVVSKANAGNAPPLAEPSMTSETLKKSTSQKSRDDMNLNVLAPPHSGNKKIPEGVVPIPDMLDQSKQNLKVVEDEQHNIAPDVDAALPGRYRNNIISNEIDKINKEEEAQQKANVLDENENVAHEIFDFAGKFKVYFFLILYLPFLFYRK